MSRPPRAQERIYRSIQKRIVGGQWCPGERLPARSELERTYRASPLTVQRVFDRLEGDGFVEARGRHGSYVSAHPPHLHHYWLVFPFDPQRERSQLRRALETEGRKLATASPTRISVYGGHDGVTNVGSLEAIEYDVTHHRTAGLIFATAPGYWRGTPLMEEPGVPRVMLNHGTMAKPPIASVCFDRSSFFRQALQYLADLGRRQVAVLAPVLPKNVPAALFAPLFASMADYGLATRPWWTQYATAYAPDCARQLMHLLMNPRQGEQPDALVILDDALVSAATEGLREAGVRAPRDLAIVAHANFPYLPKAAVPVTRLGYDVPRLMGHCLELLRRQREGTTERQAVMLPAVFEEESGLGEMVYMNDEQESVPCLV